VVLAFPCNQFGRQEPDSEAVIKKYVTENFGVTFPMMSKVEVNGPNVHPVFSYMKNQGDGAEFSADIEWNFVKFVVNRDGEVVKRMASAFDRTALEDVIESYL